MASINPLMTSKVNTSIKISINSAGSGFLTVSGYDGTVLATPTTRFGTLETPGEVLSLFRQFPAGLTKTEAAGMAGLSRTALTQRIDRLLRHGLIRAIGASASTGGRPADRFQLNRELGCLLIADTGVTGMRVALCDMIGEVLEERYETLDINKGPERVLTQIEARFAELLHKRGRSKVDVRGIGLNVPGPVDVATGRMIYPPLMAGWHDFDIRGAFGASYRCPVVIEKDGTAMAFGEHRRAYPSIPNLVFIKLGTGIGTGIVVDGKPYRGMDGGAGDVGHIAFSERDEREPPLCRCGNVGCVEAYASGWALVRDLATLGLEVASIDDVVSLVLLGNPDAIRLVRHAAAVFGTAVSDIVSILNPGVVAIGGQLAAIGDVLFAGVREVIYRRSLPLATRKLQVLQTALSERAGVLGLAELVADRVYLTEDIDLMVAD